MPQIKRPRGLKAPGSRLWDSVLREYSLEDYPEKLELLSHAARCTDTIAELERAMKTEPLTVLGSARQRAINPILSEIRFQRGLVAQLLARLNFEGATDA